MFPKHAILQVADTGPLDSLVQMLRAIGISCSLPNAALRGELRRIGCDMVLSVDDLVRSGSYDRPLFNLPEAGIADMERRGILYVDVKAQKNFLKVSRRWPHMPQLWYRINGGKPEHVINARGDHGDEVNPPCPVLTPNQWYSDPRAYACWPPFAAIGDYRPSWRDGYGHFDRPICLVHNLTGWGYGPLITKFSDIVLMYGEGSPDGPLKHSHVPTRLSKCLAYIHLKSSDAPGYALYEAMAAGCPVICTRKLIWKCKMQELLEPGVTCLAFDRETHDGFTTEDLVQCEKEVRQHLASLNNLAYNRKIGMAGRQRLEQVMWKDVEGLRDFFTRNYP